MQIVTVIKTNVKNQKKHIVRARVSVNASESNSIRLPDQNQHILEQNGAITVVGGLCEMQHPRLPRRSVLILDY